MSARRTGCNEGVATTDNARVCAIPGSIKLEDERDDDG